MVDHFVIAVLLVLNTERKKSFTLPNLQNVQTGFQSHVNPLLTWPKMSVAGWLLISAFFFLFSFSCNPCLWFVASVKGFTMFLIICFKLELYMVGYLKGALHCSMELLDLFWLKQQFKSTLVTTPWQFMWPALL